MSVAFASLLTACASAPSPSAPQGTGQPAGEVSNRPSGLLVKLSEAADQTLGWMGLKRPDPVPLPEHAQPERRIAWQVHASTSLNVTSQGQSLALVVRIYRLRQADAFLQLPPSALGDTAREKATLGDDLVAVREVQLLPGQRLDGLEKLPREAGFLGVVALFHHPAAGRWRHAFAADRAELSGVVLGAHACGLSVQSGQPLGWPTDAAHAPSPICPALARAASPASTANAEGPLP